jgi:hypothetical protein
MSAAITYEQLKRLMTERVGRGSLPAASALPNHMTALAAFMRERCLRDPEPVHSTLRLSYYKHRDAHLRTHSRITSQ